MKIPDKVYDVLKWIALLVLPALSTFIKVVFTIWNIPYGSEIAATITALAVLIGAVLGISTYQYMKDNSDKEE